MARRADGGGPGDGDGFFRRGGSLHIFGHGGRFADRGGDDGAHGREQGVIRLCALYAVIIGFTQSQTGIRIRGGDGIACLHDGADLHKAGVCGLAAVHVVPRRLGMLVPADLDHVIPGGVRGRRGHGKDGRIRYGIHRAGFALGAGLAALGQGGGLDHRRRFPIVDVDFGQAHLLVFVLVRHAVLYGRQARQRFVAGDRLQHGRVLARADAQLQAVRPVFQIRRKGGIDALALEEDEGLIAVFVFVAHRDPAAVQRQRVRVETVIAIQLRIGNGVGIQIERERRVALHTNGIGVDIGDIRMQISCPLAEIHVHGKAAVARNGQVFGADRVERDRAYA